MSSGLFGLLANDRMRRYEEKSGRLVCRVETTSLGSWWLVKDLCFGVKVELTLGLVGKGLRAPWLWYRVLGVLLIVLSRPRVGPRVSLERRRVLMTNV